MAPAQRHTQSPQPPQHQDRQPGIAPAMAPRPRAEDRGDRGRGRRQGRVALLTGGDRGIGRAVAIAFAKAGADVAIVYLSEHGDAQATRARVEQEGRRCVAVAGEVGDARCCRRAVQDTARAPGRLDVLGNTAAEQHPQERLEKVTGEPPERTVRTNLFACFSMTKAALTRLRQGSAILNTTSVTAYRGSPHLLDDSATKGAIASCTRSPAEAPVGRGIRVNGVAPGPIWTPLTPAALPAERAADFGADVPMQRPGSRRRSPRATSSWPRTTPPTWPGRSSTRTAARW